MNELTKQLQEIMVPKAALIAYEYQEGHYASGSHYLELRPINKKGRMEAGIPVTYEFMDSLVESYSDGNRRIPHGWLPPNMLWCDTRRGHESYVGGCHPTCCGAIPAGGMKAMCGIIRRENGGCFSRTT